MGPQGPQEILDLGLRLKRWIEEVAEVRSFGFLCIRHFCLGQVCRLLKL